MDTRKLFFSSHLVPLQLFSDSASDVVDPNYRRRLGSAVVLLRVDLSFGGRIIRRRLRLHTVSDSETWRHPRWLVAERKCGILTVQSRILDEPARCAG